MLLLSLRSWPGVLLVLLRLTLSLSLSLSLSFSPLSLSLTLLSPRLQPISRCPSGRRLQCLYETPANCFQRKVSTYWIDSTQSTRAFILSIYEAVILSCLTTASEKAPPDGNCVTSALAQLLPPTRSFLASLAIFRCCSDGNEDGRGHSLSAPCRPLQIIAIRCI